MAKVKFYSKREEKKQRFVLEVIEKTREFDKLLDELNSDKSNLYRGVRSAKYMLFNTAQRFFIEKELAKTVLSINRNEYSRIKELRNCCVKLVCCKIVCENMKKTAVLTCCKS
jgi:chromosome segregation ATPase